MYTVIYRDFELVVVDELWEREHNTRELAAGDLVKHVSS
jgi:hypothetical protein